MDPLPKPGSNRFLTAKIIALARWKSITDTITLRRRHNTDATFPPPSWEIDKLVIDSNNGWDQTEFEPPSRTLSGEETVAKVVETVVSTEVPMDLEPAGPEPLTFAQRIRDLIESLPLPGVLTSPRQPTLADAHEPEALRAGDGSIGPPVPPGVDQELVLMLSSEEVMNGDEGGEGKREAERQSIWSILSSMELKGKGKEKEVDPEQPLSPSSARTHGGLMMYMPLEPVNDSKLELAEVCSLNDASISPGLPVLEQPGQDVEWVPSTTQISVYTTWWGYRLYLPPSAVATLDSVFLKATAQAAVVTGALKWLLNKVPDVLVPAQFKPVLVMMRRLGPVVGYIGVFVTWSWGRIKRHDRGNGVVLTATWLLPVALIPMSWDAGNIAGPILLPKPEDRVPPPSQENDKESQSKEKKKIFRSLW
ncbi:hypothetical protein AN958_05102 [Leucoagaricus sp. SymC.cos]|nr:hypothetical protein AN958_05102 [Leucoagaricus sp. SymC.cos]